MVGGKSSARNIGSGSTLLTLLVHISKTSFGYPLGILWVLFGYTWHRIGRPDVELQMCRFRGMAREGEALMPLAIGWTHLWIGRCSRCSYRDAWFAGLWMDRCFRTLVPPNCVPNLLPHGLRGVLLSDRNSCQIEELGDRGKPLRERCNEWLQWSHDDRSTDVLRDVFTQDAFAILHVPRDCCCHHWLRSRTTQRPFPKWTDLRLRVVRGLVGNPVNLGNLEHD